MPVIRVIREDWADPDIALPAYQSDGAAGADIRANFSPEVRDSGLVLEPMERCILPTGIRVEIPFGFEMQIRPRSGLACDYGISVVNAPGTVDSDYRGPIGVLLVNLGDKPFAISHGDRIAQVVIAPVVQAGFEHVDTLGDTKRGAGGFGSTGQS